MLVWEFFVANGASVRLVSSVDETVALHTTGMPE
jgi:hypothetical protein